MKALVRQGAKRYLVARCARAYDPSGPQQYYEFMFSKELVPVADEVFPRMYTHVVVHAFQIPLRNVFFS